MKMVLRAAQGRAARRRHDGRHSETLPNQGKESGLFASKGSTEALEREIAARIEADHERPGWW